MSKPATIARKIRRTAGWLLVIVLGWCGFIAGRIIYYGSRDEAAKADVIIVLGAAVRKDQPSSAFAGRIQHGIELHKRGLAPKLLFTGGLTHDGTKPEAEVAREVAVNAGIPDAVILIEATSTKTWENFTAAARIMRENGLHSAIIVSDPYHLHRARTMAADSGITALTSPTPYTPFRTLREKIPFLLNELRLFHTHLFYRATERR